MDKFAFYMIRYHKTLIAHDVYATQVKTQRQIHQIELENLVSK